MEDTSVGEHAHDVGDVLEGVGVGALDAVELELLGVGLGLGGVGVQGRVGDWLLATRAGVEERFCYRHSPWAFLRWPETLRSWKT